MNDTSSIPSPAARPYARALYELAKGANADAAIARDLARVRVLASENSVFRALISRPTYSRTAQAAALDAILTKIGLAPMTRRFFQVLARRRRLTLLADIEQMFVLIQQKHSGVNSIVATSASPLTEEERVLVGEVVRKLLGQDAKIALEERLDPELIQGTVIRSGTVRIDASLSGALSRMERRLRTAA